MNRVTVTSVISLPVYGKYIRHEIGTLFGKEMHRFVLDEGLSSEYSTFWSTDENKLFGAVLKRFNRKLLRLV